MERGLYRLWVVFSIIWLTCFGYAAYRAHDLYSSKHDKLMTELAVEDKAFSSTKALELTILMNEKEAVRLNRNFNLWMLLAGPLGSILAFFVVVWVWLGFRDSNTRGE